MHRQARLESSIQASSVSRMYIDLYIGTTLEVDNVHVSQTLTLIFPVNIVRRIGRPTMTCVVGYRRKIRTPMADDSLTSQTCISLTSSPVSQIVLKHTSLVWIVIVDTFQTFLLLLSSVIFCYLVLNNRVMVSHVMSPEQS